MDDAAENQNANAVLSNTSRYGKPHTGAGASGFNLPRLNNGKFAITSDVPVNSTWFDTKGNSRVLVDPGRNTRVARINTYYHGKGAPG